MPFPGVTRGALQQSAPILIATTSTIAIPSTAKFMHVFAVGGGGSGGVNVNAAATNAAAGGGGCGAAAYMRVDLDFYNAIAELPLRASRANSITLTIGLGGTARSQTTSANSAGNTGGSTQVDIAGGFSLIVPGGSGGGGTGGAGAAGAMVAGERADMTIAAQGPIVIRPLLASPQQSTSTTYTSDSAGTAGGAATGTVGAETAATGSSLSTKLLLPWWVTSAGLTRGTGGAGATVASTGKAAGGGAGGFAGNGGAGGASNTTTVTAGTGAGYGSGGGGASGVNGSTATSGAGAPGVAVVLFELEV